MLPFQSTHVKQHRKIWWAGKHGEMPRILWLLEQLVFWLRWVLFSGWKSAFSSVKHHHTAIEEQFGISYGVQLRQCLSLSLGWCIPADQLYGYDVIQNQSAPLEFIYDTEVIGWHALQNRKHQGSAKAKKLLGDKLEFMHQMQSIGMPVVPILERPTKTDNSPLSEQLTPKISDIFCKLRSGNQGIGAFEARFHEGKLSGYSHGRKTLDADAVDLAWLNLCSLGDVIVQPCLRNHPAVQKITKQGTLATLRIITHQGKIAAANIALPISLNQKPDIFWMDADPQTGALSLPSNMYPNYEPKTAAFKKIAMRAPKILPYWDQMCRDSLNMHDQYFDLWAIAWDWAITPDGAFILEGNSGWGPADWQLQNGGWLA
jgi:hypothetical protein